MKARARLLLLLGCVALAAPKTHGEVYVFADTNGNVIQGPAHNRIIDDADPIPTYWLMNSQPTLDRYVLNAEGAANGDGRPAMTIQLATRTPIVVWGRSNGGGFDLVESHFTGGAWTQPAILVSGVSPDDDPEPSVAVDDATGAVHVAYSTGGSVPAVLWMSAPADLSAWTGPQPVSAVGELALRPSIVVHDGTLTVAYESHGSGVGSTPRQIVVATDDGAGGFTYSTVSSTHYDDPNRPQLHTGIDSALWMDWIDDTNGMAWSEWSGTSWGAVVIESFSDFEDREFHARGRIKRQVGAP